MDLCLSLFSKFSASAFSLPSSVEEVLTQPHPPGTRISSGPHRSKLPSPDSLLYPSLQLQQALPGNLQATPAREAAVLMTDLHLSLCSFLPNPLVSPNLCSRPPDTASPSYLLSPLVDHIALLLPPSFPTHPIDSSLTCLAFSGTLPANADGEAGRPVK